MKPPLTQIASQVSKVEVSWPTTLPLPRIAPLMSTVARRIPDLPFSLPFSRMKEVRVQKGDGDVQVIPIRPVIEVQVGPTQIFESSVEDPAQPAVKVNGLYTLTFE